MWASVPHREAASTRTSTSEAPQDGVSTSAHSRAPGRGATLRIAFIESLQVAGRGIRGLQDGWNRSEDGIIRGAPYRGQPRLRGSARAWRERSARRMVLEAPGQLEPNVPPVLLDGVLHVVLGAGIGVGLVEQ